MMLTRQVIYRQVMDEVMRNQIKITVQRQVGLFLRNERLRCGHSIEEVASMCRETPSKVISWEEGRTGPACSAFFLIISTFGQDSLRRAVEFDLELQLEVSSIRQQQPRG